MDIAQNPLREYVIKPQFRSAISKFIIIMKTRMLRKLQTLGRDCSGFKT